MGFNSGFKGLKKCRFRYWVC